MRRWIIFGVVLAFGITVSAPSVVAQREDKLPIRASQDGQHLLDAQNQPYLMVADVAWQLLRKLSLQDATKYMDIRKSQSFNTLIVQVLPIQPTQRNFYKKTAFLGTGIAEPNTSYFTHLKNLVSAAEKRQLTMALVVNRTSWKTLFQSAQPDEIQKYATYLCDLLAGNKNVIWVLQPEGIAKESFQVLAEAFRKQSPTLMVGSLREKYAGEQNFDEGQLSDINILVPDSTNSSSDYSQFLRSKVQEMTQKKDSRPLLLANSVYSKELLDQSAQIRKQAFEAFMVSGAGFCHQSTIKNFNSTWVQNIQQDGAEYIEKLVKVLYGVPWAFLETDWNSNLIVDSLDKSEVGVKLLNNKRMALLYLPGSKNIEIDLHPMTGANFRAVWYSPRTGKRWFGGGLSTEKQITLTPPETKPEWDWLVLIGSGLN
ncbi:collagenase-like protein with putative collagen-binding domain [Dyadobacter jejuensis]|uniref:Collagenase-like protein with putative collagen-binding domain n=1 Tax=Dyadobacter jejuensis TaxID=1082580 RepID=A0A316AG89_9BACT|nr:DUF4038 domain-containing protein [Dyadobacter jejuensis]PWJ56805.1 collagenase-like protein with putative collagen-binding domain [Dyadobacter jejuensis]